MVKSWGNLMTWLLRASLLVDPTLDNDYNSKISIPGRSASPAGPSPRPAGWRERSATPHKCTCTGRRFTCLAMTCRNSIFRGHKYPLFSGTFPILWTVIFFFMPFLIGLLILGQVDKLQGIFGKGGLQIP